eukprot:gene14441-20448_t
MSSQDHSAPIATSLSSTLAFAASTYASYAFGRWLNQMHKDSLKADVLSVKAQLLQEQASRKLERAGRIKAEQELRKLQLHLATEGSRTLVGSDDLSSSSDTGPASHYPCRPIGTIQSCFTQSRLQLARDINASSLDGLEQYSHVWVMYIFHENTELDTYFLRCHLHGKTLPPRRKEMTLRGMDNIFEVHRHGNDPASTEMTIHGNWNLF